LRFGVARRPEATTLKSVVEEFLLRVEVLAWNSESAQQYARVRAILEKEGSPMGNLDLMIAAHAMAAEVVLVTHGHVFRRVRGLKVEDWSR
jgi:tRNA(fMet)-specific endonuclease VapC